MTEERIQQIEAVIAQCEAKGIAWTNLLIYEHVGGQYQQVSRYLKQRRARRHAAVAVAEPPAPGEAESAQDATDALQEHEADGALVGPVSEPLPSPDEPSVPDAALPPPGLVSKLEALQQAAREADATLVRLTRERDVQQTMAQHAALALHQARRDAQQLARALRAAASQARATPAPYKREAEARVHQLQAQLAALVGEADAARIAHDSHFTPPWLRE
jgi:hypothetical protein